LQSKNLSLTLNFRRMCAKTMLDFTNNADKSRGICAAAAAYIQMCAQHKVELWMPSTCVQCAIDAELMRHGESTRIQDLPSLSNSVDTIFIVEQNTCLSTANLNSLSTLIDRSLHNRGFVNNRFALVGYGGRNQLLKPHIYTAGSKIFATASQVSLALNR